MSYDYSFGYKTKEAAIDALEGMFADCTVCEGENPKIVPYRNKKNERRYKITIG